MSTTTLQKMGTTIKNIIDCTPWWVFAVWFVGSVAYLAVTGEWLLVGVLVGFAFACALVALGFAAGYLVSTLDRIGGKR